MTLPISAMHYNEQPEFYMHNINGIKQQQITSSIAKSIFGKEFYFISRNTFPGSGKYGGHWSGDN
jgi:alpha-glucosidase (family GH31 glycosyl hydrolase)